MNLKPPIVRGTSGVLNSVQQNTLAQQKNPQRQVKSKKGHQNLMAAVKSSKEDHEKQ